jgi:hypothetical protein
MGWGRVGPTDAWWGCAFLVFSIGRGERIDWESKEVAGESIFAMTKSVTVLR